MNNNITKYKTLINGKWVDAKEHLAIIDPTNNSQIALVPNINDKEVIEEVFYNANQAYLKYSKTTVEYRVNLLSKFADLLEQQQNEVADILSLEIAKNKKESLVEVARSVEYVRQTIVEYLKLIKEPQVFDEKIHNVKGKTAKYFRLPLGVVLAISPFNYPINLLVSKLAPALIAGNSVVFKPSTQGALIGIKVAQLLEQAGYEPGVVNCLTTEARVTGDWLVTNQYVKAISFTGGPKVGNNIAKITSKISLVLELGGKDPALVLDDADLDLTANEIIKGAFSYSGQRCTAIKRVLVSKNKKDELIAKLKPLVAKLTIGHPNDNPNITSLISNASLKYNVNLVQEALDMNAKLESEFKYEEDKNLLYPVLLSNVTKDMRVAWEEPFAPVLPIIEYDSIDEALQLINQSQYGLQASIFTSSTDDELIKNLALQVESGTININRSSSRGPDILPFFGVKDSGYGVQGIVDAIISMTTIKGVVFNK